MNQPTARYRPSVFDVEDEATAKQVILTPEGMTTEQRWAQETPLLVDDIQARLNIFEGQLILDYGCGIGRVARELIQRTNCRVIGVDISAGMRKLSVDYVGSEQFSVVSRDVFTHLVAAGLRVHHALAIWVLQHSPEVDRDVELLYRAIQGEGWLYLLNNRVSAIPTDRGWVSDGVDIRQALQRRFAEIRVRDIPPEFGNEMISQNGLIGEYLRPPVVEKLPSTLSDM